MQPLTTSQVAAILATSQATISRMIADGRLTPVQTNPYGFDPAEIGQIKWRGRL